MTDTQAGRRFVRKGSTVDSRTVRLTSCLAAGLVVGYQGVLTGHADHSSSGASTLRGRLLIVVGAAMPLDAHRCDEMTVHQLLKPYMQTRWITLEVRFLLDARTSLNRALAGQPEATTPGELRSRTAIQSYTRRQRLLAPGRCRLASTSAAARHLSHDMDLVS
jgi:hypothetical protein